MTSQRTLGLLRQARLSRRQLVLFALVSAVINGIITASVGAWLGQTYAKYQARKQSIESLVHLVYERRTRAGMVASALRRGADIEEVKYRKRAYDEAYVDWNKSIMQNIFAIREVTGEYFLSKLEGHFQDALVAAMADVDRCLTKAYDARVAEQDPKPILEQCRMPVMHQFVLDCGATFTNEIYKLTKLSFIPFSTRLSEGPEKAEQRIARACTRPPEPPPAPAVAAPVPVAPEVSAPATAVPAVPAGAP
ncbi:MAG: hypothetical protein B7Y80_00385 [Hyphomicrobium sp. 32-62-53]|nr:MAG: hypothetical protein B7Z29_13705 [Hyphomicrobium sp. 12-62-95]OYY01816.1 MAG: hypothetical protein B7Y80_00385 [Hyphomicrobium sp. 32-62-53]